MAIAIAIAIGLWLNCNCIARYNCNQIARYNCNQLQLQLHLWPKLWILQLAWIAIATAALAIGLAIAIAIIIFAILQHWNSIVEMTVATVSTCYFWQKLWFDHRSWISVGMIIIINKYQPSWSLCTVCTLMASPRSFGLSSVWPLMSAMHWQPSETAGKSERLPWERNWQHYCWEQQEQSIPTQIYHYEHLHW